MIWSFVLAAVGIAGIYLAGRKSKWGWGLGLAAQVLWVVFALTTAQYGFIRADQLRMLNAVETQDYLNSLKAPLATPQATLAPVNPNSLSSYGYVICCLQTV